MKRDHQNIWLNGNHPQYPNGHYIHFFKRNNKREPIINLKNELEALADFEVEFELKKKKTV